MLINERMLESYVEARRWLKPGGAMMPTNSVMFVCPFSDTQLYLEVGRVFCIESRKTYFS